MVNISVDSGYHAAVRFALLGLGEAGGIYARALAGGGATVTAADPAVDTAPEGVVLTASIADAVADADLVLSLVGARAAEDVLVAALASMRRDAVFADLNTGAPEQKSRLADRARDAGVAFADVAVMAPVPRAGIGTRLFASGPGADAFAAAIRPFGAPVDVVGDRAGDAAGLKLLRSVFMKGLAGLVLESLDAADRIGANRIVRDQIATELGPNGDALVERLVEGSRQHAARREHEMQDARRYLEQLGTPPRMTDGTLAWLRELADASDAGR